MGIAKLAFAGVVGLVGLDLCFNAAVANWTYSEGDRVGYVDKFSYKGLFAKTHEGQLAMQNFVAKGDNGAMTNTFEFSVRAEETAVQDALSKAQDDHSCVKLHYIQTVGSNFWQQGTDYRIVKVSPVSNCGPAPALNQ